MRFFKYTEKPGSGDTKDVSGIEHVKSNSKRVRSFWAPIICFVTATALWYYVSGDKSVTFQKEFSGIEVQQIGIKVLDDRGYSAISELDTITVDVTLSGTRRDINSIEADDIKATVDLSKSSGTGEKKFKINVSVPGDVKVKNVFPSEAVLFIGTTTTNKFDVIPVPHNLVFANSTGIEKYDIETEYVYVSGPQEELNRIESAVVEIDFFGEMVSESLSMSNMKIKLIDNRGEEIRSHYLVADKTETDVDVIVFKTATVAVKPVYSDGINISEKGYSVKVEPETVTVKGSPEAVNRLIENGYIETVKIDSSAEISGGTSTVEKMLDFPNGVKAEKAEDSKVKLTFVRENGSVEKTVKNVVFINADKSLTYTCAEEEITVKFYGNLDEIERIDENSLYFVADLSSVKAGDIGVKIAAEVKYHKSGILETGKVEVDGKHFVTVSCEEKALPEENAEPDVPADSADIPVQSGEASSTEEAVK